MSEAVDTPKAGWRMQVAIFALCGATLIAAFCLFRLRGIGAQASSLPPLHDIQTDWDNPIQFSEAIMSARAAQGETNPVLDAPTVPDYAEARWPGTAGRLVSEVQEEAETKEGSKGTVYPPLETLYIDQSPRDVAAIAGRIIDKRGWNIAFNGATTDGGEQIDATATSGWFGFKDDVAVRLRAANGVTAVATRSTSRVGLSDLGANSTRVYGMMMELQDRADGRNAP